MPLHSATATQIYTFPDVAALSQGLDRYVAKLSAEAIKRHGKFTIAISGGSLPKQLSAVLKHNPSVDFVRRCSNIMCIVYVLPCLCGNEIAEQEDGMFILLNSSYLAS